MFKGLYRRQAIVIMYKEEVRPTRCGEAVSRGITNGTLNEALQYSLLPTDRYLVEERIEKVVWPA